MSAGDGSGGLNSASAKKALILDRQADDLSFLREV
jgi:hypothetical protein